MAGPSVELGLALLSIFGIIFIGYVLARFKILERPGLAGIGTFAGKVALPALLTKAVAELQFEQISWVVVGGVLLARFVLFCAVLVVSFLASNRRLPRRIQMAGLDALFTVQVRGSVG